MKPDDGSYPTTISLNPNPSGCRSVDTTWSSLDRQLNGFTPKNLKRLPTESSKNIRAGEISTSETLSVKGSSDLLL